jgi:hypothetical protein
MSGVFEFLTGVKSKELVCYEQKLATQILFQTRYPGGLKMCRTQKF